jgi:PAT family beta-lactamase induction signal transducer AmpG
MGLVLRSHSTAAAAPAGSPGPNSVSRNPWAWIPSLYYFQGLPNVLAVSVSVVLYKNLGLSNTAAAFYTSWLYLPWVVKPLWSPVVDLLRTRRWWIWWMQFFVAAGLACVALTIPTAYFLQLTLAGFWLVAFGSATHDIAADGFYIIATNEREQAFFSGVRNTAFNLAKITAQGLLVAVAGMLKERTGSFAIAWSITFGAAAGICFCLAMYHRFVLPQPIADRPRVRRESAATVPGANRFFGEFLATFTSFFAKPGTVTTLCFLLLYRFGEAQLLKMVQPFLIGDRGEGGLGLTNAEFGFIYGTIGVIALVGGGLLGGFLISRHGLKFWLWPMVLAMHLPDAVFVYLAHARPESLGLIGACVAVEQFGYGFGFAAYMLYMIYIARGEHATAHYAICTGFMALGMMLPGMWSGWLQEHLGYRHFFVWVLLATIPGFIVTALVPLEPEFGRKNSAA